MAKTLVLLHRAGHHKKYSALPNTILRAQQTARLSTIDGYEIDVRSTKDRKLVVIHDAVSHLTLAQFRQQYPHNNTLTEWVTWLKIHPNKTVYLDLKEDIPAQQLLTTIASVHHQIILGSRKPRYVSTLVRARNKRNLRSPINFMIWQPFFPSMQIRVANYYFTKHGRPDGIHWSYDDRAPHGLQWLHLLLLKHMTKTAQRLGYQVSAGASSSRSALKRMLSWGVSTIMPNHHEQLPK